MLLEKKALIWGAVVGMLIGAYMTIRRLLRHDDDEAMEWLEITPPA